MTQRPEQRRGGARRVVTNRPVFLGQGNGEEGSQPQDDPAQAAAAPPRQAGPAATVEWLDPKTINWPEGRITSEYDEERAAALRRSMAEMGQQDAIGVIQLEDGSYEGAAGMNRCQAAIESGTAQVLCIVRQGSHRDVVKGNLATSINQSRANPLSEVEGIAHAFDVEGFDLEELVLVTGKSAGWVEDRLVIAQASPAVKQSLGEGRIAIGHAALLARIEHLALQEELLGLQLMHGWTVKELEAEIRGAGAPGGNEPTDPAPPSGEPRRKPPLKCNYCQAEQDITQIQTLHVCVGCSGNLGPNPVIVKEGEMAVPVDLLREAAGVLAGSQSGARLAERIADLLGK